MTATPVTIGTRLSDEQLRQLGFQRGSLIVEDKKEATIVPKHAFVHMVEDIVAHKRKLYVVQEMITQRLLGVLRERKHIEANPSYKIFPSWFRCYIATFSPDQVKELGRVFGINATSAQTVQ